MNASICAASALLLFAAIPAAGEASPAPVPVESLSESVRAPAAAVDAFHAALRRGEPEAALALVAGNALVFEDGRVERTKAEYALHHAAADAAFSKAVPSKQLSRSGQASGQFALISSESRARGRFKGQEVDRIMVETMVLRRDPGGAWKIVHIHWSSAEPSTE